MLIKPEDTSYTSFQDMLNGYRLTKTLMTACDSGVFDIIGSGARNAEIICKETGWDKSHGLRFLEALCSVGFLMNIKESYELTAFSKKYLVKTSPFYQGGKLSFETRLIESWDHLKETLKHGKRVYGINEKSRTEYEEALNTYLEAMDDAARVRARELWDVINPGEAGTILDTGAGSGAFLIEFLNRYKGWNGIFCDLPDVVNRAKQLTEIHSFNEKLTFVEANLLETSLQIDNDVDLVLISNLIHCQGNDETVSLINLRV